jgi:hypothetical protein
MESLCIFYQQKLYKFLVVYDFDTYRKKLDPYFEALQGYIYNTVHIYVSHL